ncbi:MAG: glycerophosphodiester phosphodiesterase family protein [Pirellulales bacterium]
MIQVILVIVLYICLMPLPMLGDDTAATYDMPRRGICAHRGASDTHPENTLSAFHEAIRLGAQMIEFDVSLTSDGTVVLMHDSTLDRTTNGEGSVSRCTVEELKKLDAGAWKDVCFQGERIPTLAETLAIMPDNIWLNVHLKGGGELAEKVTREIRDSRRLHQAFLACSAASAASARRVESKIQICNMERQTNTLQYVNETIDMGANFIQLLGGSVNPDHSEKLRQCGVRINYCCGNEAERILSLYDSGVEFPLVDDVATMLHVADEKGIPRLQPRYHSRLRYPTLETPASVLLDRHRLAKGEAQQGLALSEEFYFTSTARSIFRYDPQWNFIEEKPIHIDGVNHLGAIDYHQGYIWAGLLNGPEHGHHDPKLNRGIIAKIRASDLEVVHSWDISDDVTWVDPVCFDGEYLWVGDLSDLGIHRYRINGNELEHDGVLRYPKEMHFSQGLRVRGKKVYSMHTFAGMDGLFEFHLPEKLTNQIQHPVRVWHIAEPSMHLEGFDFLPEKPMEIWHAQGTQVDRYRLSATDAR